MIGLRQEVVETIRVLYVFVPLSLLLLMVIISLALNPQPSHQFEKE